MMKKMKLILVATLFVIFTVFLTACGDNPEPQSLAVVIRKGSNFADITEACESIYQELYNSAYSCGRAVFVRCDGSPFVYGDYDIPEQDIKGLSEKRQRTEAEEVVAALQPVIAEAAAVSEEVDTLEAINLAAKSLMNDSGNKVLLICDSGLSTFGYLDFTQPGMTLADPGAVVQALETAHAIPDLQGITVKWAFFGQSVAPQEKLSERQLSNIQDIWEAVLLTGGAESVEWLSSNSTGIICQNAPYVSLVEPEDRTIMVEYTAIETKALDNTAVRFVGDQAVFADEEAAQSAVYATAIELISHPENQVYVIGTTAGGKSDFSMQLSKDRAEAVKKLLISYGIDESRMICLGMGPDNPWHTYDLDVNGQMIEEIAETNRCVYIIDTMGSDAALIL